MGRLVVGRVDGDGCFARIGPTVFDPSGGDGGGGVDAARRACLSGLGLWLFPIDDVVVMKEVLEVEVDGSVVVVVAAVDGWGTVMAVEPDEEMGTPRTKSCICCRVTRNSPHMTHR